MNVEQAKILSEIGRRVDAERAAENCPQPAASVDREALIDTLGEALYVIYGDYRAGNDAECVADALIAAGWHNRPEAVVRNEALRERVRELGNQIHNLGCEYQNNEKLSERLGELRSEAWNLARCTTPSETADDKVEALVALLHRWQDVATNCEITSGVCCCGDNMGNHAGPMISNHSPLDEGEYVAERLVSDTAAALASIGGQRNA